MDQSTHSESEASVSVPDDATPETLIMRRYLELGTTIRDLMAERDHIRDTELVPMMLEDGIQFRDGEQYLRFEFVEKVDFDHKAARKAGDISDEVWRRYISVKVERRLMARKIKDEMQIQAEQQLLEAMCALVKSAKQPLPVVDGNEGP